MKISRPTKLTITSMIAESGSSTQPRRSVESPIWNQSKLCVSCQGPPAADFPKVLKKAMAESKNDIAIVPIGMVAANRRCGWLVMASTAAANRGSKGISQRFWIIQSIYVLSLQRIDFVEIDGFVMPVNRDDQCESDGCFCCRHRDGNNHKHDAGKRLRIGAVTPKRNEIEVGRV